MGSFYTKIGVSGAPLSAVEKALKSANRKAFIAQQGEYVLVFDKSCEEQDEAESENLSKELSSKAKGTALAFLNHDDDILCYWLASGGKIIDRFNSCPEYFDEAPSKRPKSALKGDATALCKAFGSKNEAKVKSILRSSKDTYVFEMDRHKDLVEALGLPAALIGFGFEYLSSDEFPTSMKKADFKFVQ